MKKKKLKKQIKILRADMIQVCRQLYNLSEDISKHQCYCENYKPKTVTFKRYTPFPPVAYPEKYKAEALYERETSSEAGSEED